MFFFQWKPTEITPTPAFWILMFIYWEMTQLPLAILKWPKTLTSKFIDFLGYTALPAAFTNISTVPNRRESQIRVYEGKDSVCRFKSLSYYRHLAASPSFGGQLAEARRAAAHCSETRQNVQKEPKIQRHGFDRK